MQRSVSTYIDLDYDDYSYMLNPSGGLYLPCAVADTLWEYLGPCLQPTGCPLTNKGEQLVYQGVAIKSGSWNGRWLQKHAIKYNRIPWTSWYWYLGHHLPGKWFILPVQWFILLGQNLTRYFPTCLHAVSPIESSPPQDKDGFFTPSVCVWFGVWP